MTYLSPEEAREAFKKYPVPRREVPLPTPSVTEDPDSVWEYSADLMHRNAGKAVEVFGSWIGSDSLEQWGKGFVEEQDIQIAEGGYTSSYHGDLSDAWNEEGLAGVIGWTAEKGAESSVSSAPPLVLGALSLFFRTPLGRVISAGGALYAGFMGVGETRQQQEEKGVATKAGADTLAIGAGVIYGILEKYNLLRIFGNKVPLNKSASKVVSEIAKKADVNTARRVAKEFGKMWAKNTSSEIITELGQTGTSIAATTLGGGKFTGGELVDQALNTAFATLPVGGTLTGPSSYVQASQLVKAARTPTPIQTYPEAVQRSEPPEEEDKIPLTLSDEVSRSLDNIREKFSSKVPFVNPDSVEQGDLTPLLTEQARINEDHRDQAQSLFNQLVDIIDDNERKTKISLVKDDTTIPKNVRKTVLAEVARITKVRGDFEKGINESYSKRVSGILESLHTKNPEQAELALAKIQADEGLSKDIRSLIKSRFSRVKGVTKAQEKITKQKKAREQEAPIDEDITPALIKDLPTAIEDYDLHPDEKYGFHTGDLGKAEDFKKMTSGRDTGHFGTGVYFVSDPKEFGSPTRSNRPVHKIDLSGYNLFKPAGVNEAHLLHNALKQLNKLTHKIGSASRSDVEDVVENLASSTGTEPTKTYQVAARAILDTLEAVGFSSEKGMPSYYETPSNVDTAATRFMKGLGYEGVDVRGLKPEGATGSLDNTTYGTVVYDLKTTDESELGSKDIQFSKATSEDTEWFTKSTLTPEKKKAHVRKVLKKNFGNLVDTYTKDDKLIIIADRSELNFPNNEGMQQWGKEVLERMKPNTVYGGLNYGGRMVVFTGDKEGSLLTDDAVKAIFLEELIGHNGIREFFISNNSLPDYQNFIAAVWQSVQKADKHNTELMKAFQKANKMYSLSDPDTVEFKEEIINRMLADPKNVAEIFKYAKRSKNLKTKLNEFIAAIKRILRHMGWKAKATDEDVLRTFGIALAHAQELADNPHPQSIHIGSSGHILKSFKPKIEKITKEEKKKKVEEFNKREDKPIKLKEQAWRKKYQQWGWSHTVLDQLQDELRAEGYVIDANDDVVSALDKQTAAGNAEVININATHFEPILDIYVAFSDKMFPKIRHRMRGEDLQGVRDGADLINLYFIARRVWGDGLNQRLKERQGIDKDNLSGWSDEEVLTLLNSMKNEGLLDAEFNPIDPQIKDLAKKMDQLARRELEIAFNSGFITKEEHDLFKKENKHYVPFTRLKEDLKEGFDTAYLHFDSSNDYGFASSKLKKALVGTFDERPELNVIQNMREQVEHTINRAQQNKSMQTLHSLISHYPDASMYELNPVIFRTDVKKDVKKQVKMSNEEIAHAFRLDDASTEIDKQGIIPVYIEGEIQIIRFNYSNTTAKQIAKGLKHRNTASNRYFTIQWRRMMRFMSMVFTTLSLHWLIKNSTKDYQTALVNINTDKSLSEEDVNEITRALLGRVKSPMFSNIFRKIYKYEKNHSQIVRDLMTGDIGESTYIKTQEEFEIYKDLMEFELQGGRSIWADSYRKAESSLDRLNREIKKARDRKEGKRRNPFRVYMDITSYLSAASENQMRFAAYLEVRNRRVAQGSSIGEAKKAAASVAKNLTINFDRHGMDHNLNNLFLFMNAAIQGTARYIAAPITSIQKKIEGKPLNVREKKFWQLTGYSMSVAFMAEMASLMLSGEDDDSEKLYNELPWWKKSMGFNIYLPSSEGTAKTGVSSGTVITIPVGYGLAFFTSLAQKMARASYQATNGDIKNYSIASEAGDIVSSFVSNYVPTPLGEGAAVAVPSVIRPAYELLQNQDGFGKMIYREPFHFDKTPTPYAFLKRERTLDLYAVLPETIAKLTGGDELKKSLVEKTLAKANADFLMSPDVWQYLSEYFMGDVSRTFRKTAESTGAIYDALNNREISPYWNITKIPLVSVGVAKAYDYDDSEQFMERREAIFTEFERLKAGYKADQKLLNLHALFLAVDKKIMRVKREIGKVRKSNLSEEMKNIRIWFLQSLINENIDTANKRWYEVNP